jgi:peroxiredoxin Q/BCP
VIEAYGAWGEQERDGKKVTGLLRSTFIIGEDGLIRKAYPQVAPAGHSAAVLADLDEIG